MLKCIFIKLLVGGNKCGDHGKAFCVMLIFGTLGGDGTRAAAASIDEQCKRVTWASV
jgi:hypothetical protein